MNNDTAITAHFERHLGRARLVLQDLRGVFSPKHVYGAPPCKGRPHWVRHTKGASIHTLEGRRGEERHVEFVMSLPKDWSLSEKWPAHMFHRASCAIVTVGKAPVDGDVFVNSAESIRGSPKVFALLVARSRQLGEHAQFRVPSDRLIEVYAMYPLTYDEHRRHQDYQLDIATLPEVIEQWPEMLR